MIHFIKILFTRNSISQRNRSILGIDQIGHVMEKVYGNLVGNPIKQC